MIPAAIDPPLAAGCRAALGGPNFRQGGSTGYVPLLEQIGLKLPIDKRDTCSLFGTARSPWSAPGT